MDTAPNKLPVTAVTVCKGRLANLRKALPTWLALPLAEVVIVDAECPDGTAAWARSLGDARVKVVELKGLSPFNIAAARNVGVRGATSPWLLMIDTDIVLKPGFADVLAKLQPGHYHQCQPMIDSLGGTALVERRWLDTVEGYDEAYQNFGDEDQDLYRRLTLYGVRFAGFDPALVYHEPHDDTARTRFFAESSKNLALLGNVLYGQSKIAIMRQTGQPIPIEVRRQLYARATEIAKASATQNQPGEISMGLQGVQVGPFNLQTGIWVRMTPPPAAQP